MRILITGATGFIGGQLGKALVKEGHQIVALVRDSNQVDLPYPAELLSWDTHDVGKVDAVIHLAGESIAGKRWTQKRKKQILESRTNTTQKLANILKSSKSHPKVILSASAIGFYGNRGDEILDEKSSRGSGFLAETCIAWESASQELASLTDRLVQLRFGIVLERFGGALVEILPIFKRGFGGKLGSGKQWMSWIHLEDLIGILLFALKNENVSGLMNTVSPNPVTNKDFTKILARVIKAGDYFPAPAIGLKIVLGEMSSLLLDSQRVKERFSALGYKFLYADLEKALTAICKNVERARGLLTQEHRAETWLSVDESKAFQFFSDCKNLEKITPAEYELKVISQSTKVPQEGTVFEYSMKCKGITVNCKSHVMEWIENKKMANTHEKGPYAFWLHTLCFEKLGNGTLVVEKVLYRWKYGFVGELFCQTSLKKRLADIFRYRMKKTQELLR
jgi:uncharacterized protein